MEIFIAIFAFFFVLMLFALLYQQSIKRKRSRFIDTYRFPESINKKLAQTYPQLTEKDIELVIKALREYFHVINLSNEKMVSMPSQAIDIAWHEFILFTREYQRFCKRGLGHFLHHTPAEAMKSKTDAQDGIKRAWRIACSREGINAKAPERLPLIFAIDAMFTIEDGFFYELDCMAGEGKNNKYCGTHIGCSSGCSGSSGDTDGCGGGCGGGD